MVGSAARGLDVLRGRSFPFHIEGGNETCLAQFRAMKSGKGGARPGAGRPATGRNPMAGVRLSPEKRREVEEWAAQQGDKPSFSEAVRRLIDLGLLFGADDDK